MKRFHLHLGVENMDKSIAFYSALFGAQPVKIKPDYAKWMLDDPRINFAISTRAGKIGLDHLGLQVDEATELEALRTRLAAADLKTYSEGEAVCCYARSEKSWVEDPNGIAWEAYHTMEDAQLFVDSPHSVAEGACCAPRAPQVSEKTEKSNCCAPSSGSSNKSSSCCG